MRTPRIAAATGALALAAVLGLVSPRPAAGGTLEDAQAACAKGRWSEAADLFGRVLEKEEGNRDAALGLTRVVVKGAIATSSGLAERGLLKVLAKDGEDLEARVALGEIYLTRALTDENNREALLKGDAAPQFERVLATDPAHEAAAVGLARTRYWAAQFDEAVKVLDAFLSKAPASGPALFWKGQVYYFQAEDAYRSAPQGGAATKLFQQALAAFTASVKADPSPFDSWMKLAYSAQYLGDPPGAEAAYAEAMERDAESPWPLRGIQALYERGEAGKYANVLEVLAKRHPKNVAVHFFLGQAHLKAERYEEAVRAFQTFLKSSKSPGSATYGLGLAYTGLKEEGKAVRAFEDALESNPEDFLAAEELDRRLRTQHATAARSSLKAAEEAKRDYARLLEKAPKNPYVRNNVGFILREAYVAHQQDRSWVPVLKDSIQAYEEASEIIGEWSSDMKDTVPWRERYASAQMLSDTGLMFQFYEPTKDYVKAEAYYERALDFSNGGYLDAFQNLLKIYKETQRWQKAYDLAAWCADGLKDANGNPHPNGRAQARGEMKRLLDEGKAHE